MNPLEFALAALTVLADRAFKVWDDYDGVRSCAYGLCVVAMALMLAWGITAIVSHYPHDWDCAKHGGLAQTPGVVVVGEKPTVCVDGYRP